MSLLLAMLLAGCGRKPEPAPMVLLVSFDTTRADALGCYGAAGDPTPVVDGLAARGVRFEMALSHAPTTLNSHASVFSGTDPHTHAVPRNGYPVPETLPLVTERLRDAGWDTIAVVGASALEQAMGLNRGFRVYDDDVGRKFRRRFEDTAEGVTARALEAIDKREPGKPVFFFVHYYDAHTPWDSAPREVQDRFVDAGYDGLLRDAERGVLELARRVRAGTAAERDLAAAWGLYEAEVSYADSQLGALLEGLEDRGLLRDALVVTLADHGESMAENRQSPFGHGPDVGIPEIHVPLIFAGTGRYATPVGATVARQVRLMDVAPTVLSVVGDAAGIGQGEDLRPLWSGQTWDAPPSFAEATKPIPRESSNAWNNLPFERSVAHGGYFLTRAEVLSRPPALYRLEPGQPAVTGELETRARLIGLLDAWDAAAPPHRDVEMDPATAAALKALGYLE